MSLLNTPCKHSQCRVKKVCEPLDLITGWPSFGSNNISCSCKSDLHNSREEFRTIPLYKYFSVQQYSWDVWWEKLSRSCHSISIRVRSGLWLCHSRKRIFFFCPVASPNFRWASIGRQPYILLQNVLINLGINLFVDDSKLSRTWGSKADPYHDARSTILYSWDKILMLVCFSQHSVVCSFQTTQL